MLHPYPVSFLVILGYALLLVFAVTAGPVFQFQLAAPVSV